jgi:hypothetical protein
MAMPYLRDRRPGDNHSGSARERFGKHYRHEYPCGPNVCAYCGDPATESDHVVPISHLARLAAPRLDHPDLKRGLVVVPACRPCNVMLRSFVAFSVDAKRDELKRRLRSKYRRLLGAVEWDQDELDELGPSLRGWVAALDDRARHLWLRYSFTGAPERQDWP